MTPLWVTSGRWSHSRTFRPSRARSRVIRACRCSTRRALLSRPRSLTVLPTPSLPCRREWSFSQEGPRPRSTSATAMQRGTERQSARTQFKWRSRRLTPAGRSPSRGGFNPMAAAPSRSCNAARLPFRPFTQEGARRRRGELSGGHEVGGLGGKSYAPRYLWAADDVVRGSRVGLETISVPGHRRGRQVLTSSPSRCDKVQ